MAQSIPLKSTTLKKLAPEYVVDKLPGLIWDQAVEEADARFGTAQPARAVFLRKYLGQGSPESRLAELRLEDAPWGVGSHGSKLRTFVFGPARRFMIGAKGESPAWPPVTINAWTSKGKIDGEPKIHLMNFTFEGVTYRDLTFDTRDRLISTSQESSPGGQGHAPLRGSIPHG